MRSRYGLRAAFAIAAVSAGGLQQTTAADERIADRGMAVSVAKAEERCFKDRILVSGVLEPRTEIKVWAERNGLQVAQVLVEPGDTVGTGQVLARLVEPTGTGSQTVAVKSPVSGVAIGVAAIVGSYASTTPTSPMFRIMVDGELEMRGEILASYLSRVQVGQAAALHVMGFGSVDGHVASIGTSVAPLTQLGSVRIAFAPDFRLRPGAFVHADIDAGQTCAVTVPLSAVLYGSEGDVVQVVKGDHVETRRVAVGLSEDGSIQIQDGVEQGEMVIARSGGFLREGDSVRPVAVPDARKP